MRTRTIVLTVLAVGTGLIGGLIAFQPWTANHFGYALPLSRGLPCRVGVLGRHYDNNDQCRGMNVSAWERWYAKQHHLNLAAGGSCISPAELRREGNWPLRTVAGISTLFGSSHGVMTAARVPRGMTPTVLFVQDGSCYRPYSLSGGP